MRYLGGKSKHAKEIAKAIAPRGLWWDAFCGGFAMATALSEYGPGVASDAHPALISLHRAVAAGWEPPRDFSEEQHKDAQKLPDSNPLKAFAGFGCSFGGLWFHTFAKDSTGKRNYASQAANSLRRGVRGRPVEILRLDFLDVDPFPVPGLTIRTLRS